LSFLVVAADDGVMPQTVEASITRGRRAFRSSWRSIKSIYRRRMRKKIRRELSQHQLLSGRMGRQNGVCGSLREEGTNIDKLLEMLLLEAELMELKPIPNAPLRVWWWKRSSIPDAVWRLLSSFRKAR